MCGREIQREREKGVCSGRNIQRERERVCVGERDTERIMKMAVVLIYPSLGLFT